MYRAAFAAFIIAFLMQNSSNAAEIPEALKGKSVVVTWSETRRQRDQQGQGWSDVHTVTASHNLTVYVSTKGHLFSRQMNSTGWGKANMDQVGAQGSGGYPVRTPSFSGQTMVVVGVANGGAKRTIIDFDASFASCGAKTVTGFEPGKSSVSLSPISNKMVDIRSVVVSGQSCSVQSGNVLGGSS